MKKTNKLPQKKTQFLNAFKAMNVSGRITESDTTVITSGLTTTHVLYR